MVLTSLLVESAAAFDFFDVQGIGNPHGRVISAVSPPTHANCRFNRLAIARKIDGDHGNSDVTGSDTVNACLRQIDLL